MQPADPKKKTSKKQPLNDGDLEALQQQLEHLRLILNQAMLEKQEIADANKNLENIIAMMPGNIYWKHVDGRYEYCNDAVAKMCNLAHRDEIKGKYLHEFMPPETALMADENDNKVIAKGEPMTFEEIGYDYANQRESIYLTKKAPLKDNQGKVIGVFGLAVDITDRKQMETELDIARSEAEIASEAKTEFIANMSHDLRTPFSGIIGFAHHLYESEADASRKEELGYIIQSSEKLLSLLNDILQTSKDGTHHQFIFSEFNFLDLVDETKTLFIAEIERKKLCFDVSSAFSHVKVRSDKHRLHRILINLLSNAVKFTEQGGITVKVDIIQRDDQDVLVFSITDTGLGIPETAYKTIFQRFTRLSSSYHGKYVGTGVGLWLVKQFIHDLSGDIQVDSEKGQGSTFTCHIPVKSVSYQRIEKPSNAARVEKTNSHHKSAESTTTHRRLRVLMVEDNEITMAIQQQLLQEIHTDVDIAKNGSEAINLAQENHYDLILMDIGLPDMNGFATADQIRRLATINAKTPIVGLTAHLNQAEQAHWQDSAIDKLVLKPLTHAVCVEFSHWLAEQDKSTS